MLKELLDTRNERKCHFLGQLFLLSARIVANIIFDIIIKQNEAKIICYLDFMPLKEICKHRTISFSYNSYGALEEQVVDILKMLALFNCWVASNKPVGFQSVYLFLLLLLMIFALDCLLSVQNGLLPQIKTPIISLSSIYIGNVIVTNYHGQSLIFACQSNINLQFSFISGTINQFWDQNFRQQDIRLQIKITILFKRK